MKILFAVVSLVFASAAQADIIKCSFTEPFINTSYSMTQSTLTYTYADGTAPKVVKNVSFQIVGANTFELQKSGKVLQTLNLNFKGSDGMSDNTYPYDVKSTDMVNMANGGYGGCSSNFLHTVMAQDNN